MKFRTRALKVKACQFCKLANKTKLRQSRDYCDDFVSKNGHCSNFKPTKKVKTKEVKSG